jgi:hypothetical protein
MRLFESMNRSVARSGAHVVVVHRSGLSTCYLGPRSITSHRQSQGITEDPPPPNQHTPSRESFLTQRSTHPWIVMIASDSREIDLARSKEHQEYQATHSHQLRDTDVKVAASVGVELRQIYLLGCCSQHPNNA